VRIRAIALFISLLFVTGISSSPLVRSSDSTHFVIPGSFLYTLNSAGNVFDVDPGGAIAVSLTSGINERIQSGILTSFDPRTGAVFDTKDTDFGPAEVREADTLNGKKVVVLSTEGGANTVTLFDMSPLGKLAQRASTRLTESNIDYRSQLVLSAAGGVGFVIVFGTFPLYELVAFSLNDGSIISRTVLASVRQSVVGHSLAMTEHNGRRILIYLNGTFAGFSLTFNAVNLDVTDPAQPKEMGSVGFPARNTSTFDDLPGMAFSADSRLLFLAGGTTGLQVIDLSALKVVAAIDDAFFDEVRVFDGPTKRFVALVSSASFGNLTLLLLDATDPSSLAIVSRLDFPDRLYGKAAVAFSQSGNELFLASGSGIMGLSVPSLTTLQSAPFPNPQEGDVQEIRTLGHPEAALAAWGITTAQFISLASVSDKPLDVCLQDDKGGAVLRLSSTTGDYVFTRCSDSFTFSGRGSIRLSNSIVYLTDSRAEGRISAGFMTGQRTGRATITLAVAPGVYQTVSINSTDPNPPCECGRITSQ